MTRQRIDIHFFDDATLDLRSQNMPSIVQGDKVITFDWSFWKT